MFTGLIEETGKILSLDWENTNLHITIKVKLILEDIHEGDSIAINGVCLTATSFTDSSFKVTAVKETLDVTTLMQLEVGSEVNLERCLKAEDRLGGHIVQGHVDTIAELDKVIDQNGSYDLYFKIPENYTKYIIKKGSISISGISLTVVDVGNDYFYVTIIPATWEKTNLKALKSGDNVNIEVDVLAKYMEKLSENYLVKS